MILANQETSGVGRLGDAASELRCDVHESHRFWKVLCFRLVVLALKLESLFPDGRRLNHLCAGLLWVFLCAICTTLCRTFHPLQNSRPVPMPGEDGRGQYTFHHTLAESREFWWSQTGLF
ncbi:hypothetical protein ILYODFUR_034471 [Ilyodon furcidens]|uniref:Uncharacterized protein n=1 Tax=Ilyodon furcidens TaxID=33524 RepID=A0ABV0TFC5_9TELE